LLKQIKHPQLFFPFIASSFMILLEGAIVTVSGDQVPVRL
jgi:hypothetical protein